MTPNTNKNTDSVDIPTVDNNQPMTFIQDLVEEFIDTFLHSDRVVSNIIGKKDTYTYRFKRQVNCYSMIRWLTTTLTACLEEGKRMERTDVVKIAEVMKEYDINKTNFDAIDRSAVTTKQYSIGYSEEYLQLKIAQFVATAIPLLEEWSNMVGDPSELRSIRDLMKLIDDNTRFFDSKPSPRLLLGTIQNFIIKWGKIDAKQISHFSHLLEWFKEGEVEGHKVKAFSQEVFVAMHRNTKDGEIKEEKE